MALREGRELLFPPPARPRLLSSRSKERVAALFLKAPNRRALTLCFPRRLRLRHKLHLGQWKKSSLGPILGNDHGISGRHAPAATNPRRRTAPADAALVAVVLLLVAVEEVAHVAVVLPEEAAAALAALLGLPADGDTRPLGERRPPPPKMAAPPPRGRATPPRLDPAHLLQEAAARALHLGHAEAVQAVLLGAVVAQPAGVQLPAARSLQRHGAAQRPHGPAARPSPLPPPPPPPPPHPQQAAPPVVLAAPVPLRLPPLLPDSRHGRRTRRGPAAPAPSAERHPASNGRRRAPRPQRRQEEADGAAGTQRKQLLRVLKHRCERTAKMYSIYSRTDKKAQFYRIF